MLAQTIDEVTKSLKAIMHSHVAEYENRPDKINQQGPPKRSSEKEDPENENESAADQGNEKAIATGCVKGEYAPSWIATRAEIFPNAHGRDA